MGLPPLASVRLACQSGAGILILGDSLLLDTGRLRAVIPLSTLAWAWCLWTYQCSHCSVACSHTTWPSPLMVAQGGSPDSHMFLVTCHSPQEWPHSSSPRFFGDCYSILIIHVPLSLISVVTLHFPRLIFVWNGAILLTGPKGPFPTVNSESDH